MKLSPKSRHSLLLATALLAAPAALMLVALVALDQIGLLAAVLGLLAMLPLTAAILRRHLLRIDRIEAALNRALDAPGDPAEIEVQIEDDSPLSGIVIAAKALTRAHATVTRKLAERIEAGTTVIENIPDPMLLLAADATVTGANRAARELFGGNAVGRGIAITLRHPDVLKAVDAALSAGEGQATEMTLLVPVERSFAVRAEPLPEVGPDGSRALVMLHELTAMKRSEQMRADFVANASHELRTPLSALVGFIETLRGPAKDDPEAHERFLEIMHEQSLRMARLVNDLLSLSRIELNEHTPPRQPANLTRILESVKATLDMQAGAKDMRIELALAPDLPPVLGEEDELSQVVQNLIDNAVKYGRAGTHIAVTAKRADNLPAALHRAQYGAVVISVQDQGEGIAREHIPRLT
ncbi:MAG: PAS domain-containing protein, partial [Alphaproteobacteria bacterium]|nr:PAS domain-containing protein [Alphaproteobacteria bacterium]